MSNPLPFPRRQRVLMLTTDVMIDRRILHEAEALIDAGYEVILLAGSAPAAPLHEVMGRVKVHRITPAGNDPRYVRSEFLLAVPAAEIERLLSRRELSLRRLWYRWQLGTALPGGRNLLFLLWFVPFCLLALPTLLFLKAIRLGTRKTTSVLRRLVGMLSRFHELSNLEYRYFAEGTFYRPDIVHVHDLPMLAVGAALKRELRVPLFYDMHESYPDQPRLTPAQMDQLLGVERQHIGAADVVVTVNDLLLDFVRKRYALRCSSVLQNAVSAPHFDPTRRHDRFRADFPQLAGKLLVLYQGWIAKERNLETAIKAMAQVTRPEIVLLIMGYGDYAADLRALAVAEGVLDRVVFVPAKSQEELLSYSASADLGLIPYPTNRDVNTYLVSPNKLYEFITARLPILTNRLPFVERVVTQWGFGSVADLDDVNAFAFALNTFDDGKLPEYRARLAEEGWRFSWQEEQKKLLKLYEQLPGQGNPPATVAVTTEEQAA